MRLRDPTTLEVDVDKDRSLNTLFSELSRCGVEVLSLRNKSNRLEELFIRMIDKNGSREARGHMSARRYQNTVAFFTIATKEVRRFLRIWTQTILPATITMALYLIIFGSLIGPRIGEMGGFPYMSYIAPGVIMMAIITNSYGNVVSSFFGAKFQRHIEEMLVSPRRTISSCSALSPAVLREGWW